jgi:hypothetical protein
MAARTSSRVRMAALAAVAIGALAQPSLAQTVSPLRGEVFIAGKTPVDPPPEEPTNSHAYVTVSGPAALRIYQAMRAKEEPNHCRPGKLKRAGAMTCSISADGRRASCDFSLDLINGALDAGRPC